MDSDFYPCSKQILAGWMWLHLDLKKEVHAGGLSLCVALQLFDALVPDRGRVDQLAARAHVFKPWKHLPY